MEADRRKGWAPAPRPEWVAKVNDEGRCLDIAGIVPLDAASLIATACRNTGLEDFGVDDWREPFEVLVKSLDTEAALNLMGRIFTRSDLLGFLEGRLHIEDTYKKHPEIEDQEIKAPLLVTGQGRSGTTWMHNLLAADPTNRTPMTWEVLYPYPPPETASFKTDPRIERAVRSYGLWNRIAPEMATMHEFAGDIPTENIHLQCMSFQQPVWLNMLGQAPSYNAYMHGRSLIPAFNYEKRVLKYLQWHHKGARWLQKCPVYLDMIRETLQTYPDARFVWLHRDPVKALSSAVNVAGTLNWIRSDRSFMAGDSGELGNLENYAVAEASAATLDRVIDWIEDGTLPRAQLCNVQYLDFLHDPLATVRRIYDYFSIAVPQSSFDALARHIEDGRRKERPRHEYEMGPPEQVARERAIYRRYQSYFNVADEV